DSWAKSEPPAKAAMQSTITGNQRLMTLVRSASKTIPLLYPRTADRETRHQAARRTDLAAWSASRWTSATDSVRHCTSPVLASDSCSTTNDVGVNIRGTQVQAAASDWRS